MSALPSTEMRMDAAMRQALEMAKPTRSIRTAPSTGERPDAFIARWPKLAKTIPEL